MAQSGALPPAVPSRLRRLLLLGLPLGLVAGGLALALVDFGWLARRRLERQLPALEAQLGRKVQIGEVHLRLLPPRAELTELAIAAAPGAEGVAAQPLFTLRALRVGVALWPLVRSFGRAISFSHVEADGPVLRIVRLPDGALSSDDVAARLAERERKPTPPEQLRGVILQRLLIRDAALRFYEQGAATASAAPSAAIDRLTLSATDLGVERRFAMELEAAVLADRPNLHLRVGVGPVPADLQAAQPLALLHEAQVRLDRVALAPLLRFFAPPAGLGLDQATAEGHAELELPAAAGQLRLAGEAQLLGMTLADGQSVRQPGKGAPTDIRLRADLGVDPLAGTLRSQAIELSVGDMRISASADLRHLWTAPEVHALSLRSAGVTLERVLQLLPPSQRPRGEWRGPVTLLAAASGQPGSPRLSGKLDLSDATLGLPGLSKPAGAPLSAEFLGQLRPAELSIERLGLVVGAVSLFVHGQVRGSSDIDLKIDSGEVPLASLVALAQERQEGGKVRLERGRRRAGPGPARGLAQIEGALRRQGEALSAHLKARISGAQVATPALGLSGQAGLSLGLRSGPGSASLQVEADLSAARLFVPDVVDKAAGVPLRLELDAQRAGRRITLRRAEAHLPGGALALKGELDPAGHRMDLRLGPADLDLAKLGQVMPALRKKAGGLLSGRARFRAAVDGDPERLAGAHARVEDLDLGLAGGHLRGKLELSGLSSDAPHRVSFDLSGEGVDLDRLKGAGGKDEAGGQRGEPQRGEPQRGEPGPGGTTARIDGSGSLRLASGRLAGAPLRDLVAEVSLRRGLLQLKTLRMMALGGSLTASGSSFDLPRSRFHVRAQLQRIDLGLLSSVSSRGGSAVLRPPRSAEPSEPPRKDRGAGDQGEAPQVSGHASGEIDLEGGGTSWAEVAPRLQGQIKLRLTDTMVRNASMQATVVNPLVQKLQQRGGPGGAALPGPPGGAAQQRDATLREFSLNGRVLGGRIHLSEPLRIETPEGQADLSGSIGLDRTLALQGELRLLPQTIEAATQGQLSPSGPVPVSLRISGAFPRPQVELLDLGRTIAALAGAFLRGRLKNGPGPGRPEGGPGPGGPSPGVGSGPGPSPGLRPGFRRPLLRRAP